MKKTLLICSLLFGFIVNSQTVYTTVVSGTSTSPGGRAPQGSLRYIRNGRLITAAEISAAGYTSGQVFKGLGFNYSVAQSVATAGVFAAYMQNTTDATNLKSNDWTTTIATMTAVSNSSITIPAIVGTYDINFSGGSDFIYTGGALYIAYDYQNHTGALSTANTAVCSSALTGGLRGVTSPVDVAPVILASSSFRPATRIGVQSLGMTELEKSSITLCPNPTVNFVSVSGDNQIIDKIAVVSIDGRKVFIQKNINNNIFDLM